MKKKKDNFIHIDRSNDDMKKFPENEYDIYRMDELQICDYLDKWFFGDLLKSKGENSKILKDEYWTVKEVDHRTSLNLYNRTYNPVSIYIGPTYQSEKNLYSVKATIHSIDDSSYGMWKNNLTYDEAVEIRSKVIDYLNEEKVVNGNDWFEFGKSFLGFEEFDWN
jgi:hypothetical protein